MTKPYITAVHRNVGHPFTGEPGWDVMYAQLRDRRIADLFEESAHKNGWRTFIRGRDADPHGTGDGLPMLVFFKPAGLISGRGPFDWIDPWPWPYPCDWF